MDTWTSSATHRCRTRWPLSAKSSFHGRIGFLLLAAQLLGGPAALADPARLDIPPHFAQPAAASQYPQRCDDLGAEQARAAADLHLQRGEYQLAGACYRVAGASDLANRAFLKAAAPAAAASARQLAENRDQAKTQLHKLAAAFHRNR